MLNFTYFLRSYARFRHRKLKEQNHSLTQENELLKLVKHAASTRFGRDHNFSAIKSVADFQSAVPLRRYEDLWDNYWKPHFPRIENCTWPGLVPFFCVSSGTTAGRTKYIPYTQEMIKSNSKAGLDILVHHVMNRPKSQLLGGKSFVLGGSTDLIEETPGVYSGDLSGIAAKTLPFWAKSFYFPPSDIALLKNWEEKIDILAKRSLNEDIRMISGVPSWTLIFLEKLFKLRPDSNNDISKIFPNLELLVHGGVNFGPYYKQFQNLLKNTKAEMREVYPASEGFIAIADRDYAQGLKLNCDHSIFFEFVPLEELESKNPTRHWVKNIEPNINYAVVMSTAAGLWSYLIGDTVKFLETNPPRLLVTGRTSYYLSAFGEHLAGEEVEIAVTKASESINTMITDYALGALYPGDTSELGGHLLVAEFKDRSLNSSQIEKFKKTFESTLCAENEDYEAHLADGYGLRRPELIVSSNGMFAAWMKKRGKLGGQNKVPRIINDSNLFDDLVSFAKNWHS